MNKNRIALPLLAIMAALGFLVALGTSGMAASAGGTSTNGATITYTGGATTGIVDGGGTTTGAMTDAGTTTQSDSTNQGTTASPGSTTVINAAGDPSSGAAGATTNSTTIGGNTGDASTQPAVTQATTEATPTTSATAPCDTTQVTCGNNASTELALVSQTCNALSSGSVLNINIQNLAGNTTNNVTINPSTTCLNELSVTQIVEQYCLSCTVIVVPPPATVDIPVPEPIYNNTTTTVANNTTTTVVNNNNTTTTVEVPASVGTASLTTVEPQEVVGYCLPKPIIQSNGTASSLVYLNVGQPLTGADADAVPASYKAGVGMLCPASGATLTSALTPPTLHTPMFTLTVPASLVNQFVQLCVQPTTASGKESCHDVKIDDGATISVPVSGSVVAKVIKKAAAKLIPAKSKAQIASASSAFLVGLTSGASGSKSTASAKSTKTTTKGTKPAAGSQVVAAHFKASQNKGG